MAEDTKPFVFEGYGYEDLELAIMHFEKDYGFTYANDAFTNVKSIAELIDVICAPISKENKEDCTSQQAFYKLKSVLHKYSEEAVITPSSQLEKLIKRKNRIATIRSIENELGFELKVLKPTAELSLFLWLVFLGTVVSVFISMYFAMLIGFIWLLSYWIIYSNAKEFKVETVGELVKQMVMNNYFKSRRDPNTINEQEFRKMVISFIADLVGLTEEELLEAQFG
ncbi:hypothetical protein AV926_02635 [Myroides marinus]|uniref:Uncharacterized protein n=1 Tax=Myroides marinus TaxID=703342 RepID=A0A164AL45_9FLAO|nr:hypothetical protein [Myroides marinus]KZE84040.1 hypothetical protein AV926_02635 [Myroides marinus]